MVKNIYKDIPISYLNMMYLSESVDDDKKIDIIEEINNRLSKAGFPLNVMEEIKELEFENLYYRDGIELVDNNELQNFMDFTFKYVVDDRIEELLISELLALRVLPMISQLEVLNLDYRLNNFDRDINSRETLIRTRKILNMFANKQFEDIYQYISDVDITFPRHMKEINAFVRRETKLLKNMLFIGEKFAAGHEMVDYESETIKEVMERYDVPEGKLLYFRKRS